MSVLAKTRLLHSAGVSALGLAKLPLALARKRRVRGLVIRSDSTDSFISLVAALCALAIPVVTNPMLATRSK